MRKNTVQTSRLQMTMMAHVHCMLHTQGCKHTLRISNTYSFSTVTIVARTRLKWRYTYIACLFGVLWTAICEVTDTSENSFDSWHQQNVCIRHCTASLALCSKKLREAGTGNGFRLYLQLWLQTQGTVFLQRSTCHHIELLIYWGNFIFNINSPIYIHSQK